MVVSIAPNERGTGFICGHEDGSIIRFYISEDTEQMSGRIVQHQTSPAAMAWANGFIIVAGCDRRIAFYDSHVILFSNIIYVFLRLMLVSFKICKFVKKLLYFFLKNKRTC